MSKDGGPAFPLGTYYSDSGMTLRDYFAAQALTGLIARTPVGDGPWLGGVAADLAEQAYEMADAMVAARERKDGP